MSCWATSPDGCRGPALARSGFASSMATRPSAATPLRGVPLSACGAHRFRRPARAAHLGSQHERASTPPAHNHQEAVRMSSININRVVLTGNLTRDPELRSTPSGTSVCSLRIASNTRRKDATGNSVEKPNFFDVTVWGAQGENCANYLSKGRPIALDGRLEWREWEDKEGNKRQAVDIIADSVQFLGSREGGENGGRFTPQTDVPADTGDFARASAATTDDDIPF